MLFSMCADSSRVHGATYRRRVVVDGGFQWLQLQESNGWRIGTEQRRLQPEFDQTSVRAIAWNIRPSRRQRR